MQDLDFNGQLARSLKISGIFMALLCLMLILRPGDSIIWGLWVGVATGMASAFFLGKRVQRAEGMDIDQAKIQIMVGIVFRLLFIIAVLFVVSKIGWINLFATAAGIFVVHGVFLVRTLLLNGAGGEGSFKYKEKE